MKLTTQYLGLKLKNPLMPGASPLAENLDSVHRLVDAGAAAIVMPSLFEEQITAEQSYHAWNFERRNGSAHQAESFRPPPTEFHLTPDGYLAQLARIKDSTDVPAIASLNGATLGGWANYAHLIERVGADALELNFYFIATSRYESEVEVHNRAVEILQAVKSNVTIPVAVKLSPFISALPRLAESLVAHGANGLVLFNRFYQSDIDIETAKPAPSLRLSDSGELNLRLHWLAILSASLQTSYAVTGGVHTAEDAIKAIMSGADAVQMVSALLKRGPEWLSGVLDQLTRWMVDHGYESLDQIRGSMSLKHCSDPAGFERANYVRTLQEWPG